MRRTPCLARKVSIRMPGSLNTQKPAAPARRAWCRPPIGWKLRRAAPAMMRRAPSSAAPTTCAASSQQPRKAGASPPRRFNHSIDVVGVVEELDLRARSRDSSVPEDDLAVEAKRAGVAPESALPVYRQRMAFGEAVAAELRAKEEMRRHARPAHGSRRTWRRRRDPWCAAR